MKINSERVGVRIHKNLMGIDNGGHHFSKTISSGNELKSSLEE